mmetsp:Transcript_8007/g.12364  ORF Transcript_8007/g.12364 Transcript_8007/m.12364 type:complete len:145 (+) Transcript_8007:72-506(+)|eukprot:CAMPEP_0118685170 /NCGR_PEP_ID=MMETSP0800-20121206/7086_1 /TAXON_ID=210618 ORGANISM="Striatella unipunctata, Strain CCMP2910" /NCGR_SAMPLE_ID=MMETSP0800 /ASSEMBLY_ACC=CAM_ASM_000638 /LENGTH=144 /DNA_ID=CAMNT_0006582029 /DNA_START=29 /DNA_END=463 /DNA_ORIENTATION=-
MLVERKAVVSAKPSTVWSVFTDMKWEKWDPDVERVEDVVGGLADGTTFTFVMKKGGQRIATKLSNVKKDEGFEFKGGFPGGAFEGTFEFKENESDKSTTDITYKFELKGIVGNIMGFFGKKAVVHGTEAGLANVVKLSEEAELK